MDEKNETLGRRIARLRLEHGMTQERLAGELGVTPQAVSKWENDLSAPDISLLPALARTFGVSVDQLLGVQPIVRAVVPAEPEPASASIPAAAPAEPEPTPAPSRSGRPHTLHIQVHDGEDGDDVNINIPLGLAGLVLRGRNKIPGNINLNLNDADVDLDLLASAIDRGEKGTLVDVTGSDGDHVIISLE